MNVHNCELQACFAIAALGGKFHGSAELFKRTRDMPAIRDHVVETLDEAWAVGAYFVEQPWLDGDGRGREVYGYQLARYRKGSSGWSYDGPVFRSAEDFWKAMRILEDVGGKKGGCSE